VQPEQSLSGSVPAQPTPPETSPPPEPQVQPEEAPASPVPTPAASSPPPPAAAPAVSTSSEQTGETQTRETSGDDARSAKPDDRDAHQTKVRIDTPGATIEIEANEPLAEVVATALRLFHEAGGWPQVPYRSAGFVQAERRDTLPVQPSSMPYGPGAYPVQMP